MLRVSKTVWSQLALEWDAAERDLDSARARYDPIPLAENDAPKTPEEVAYDTAWDAAEACADRLLGVEAPSPRGAALQLRLFALRHHSTDLAAEPLQSEEPEAAQLRRIYAALVGSS